MAHLSKSNPAPERFAVETGTRLSHAAGIVALVLIACLVVLPFFAGRALIQDLFFVLTMLALAQFWNLLAGYAGLVSIGQQAFVGLGGYTLFAGVILLGLDPLLAIPLAGIASVAVAYPMARLVFNLRGAYFAVGTWVVAEVLRLLLMQVKVLGGGSGTSLPTDVSSGSAIVQLAIAITGKGTGAARDIAAYWLALMIAIGATALVYGLLRSRRGLALAAIGDNEASASSVGVESSATKLMVYLIAAFGTGMTGALIYLQKARISPDAAFSVVDWTAFVFFIVIIGGIATIEGPIIGVIVFWLIQDQLAQFGPWYLLLLGALAIFMMLVFPKGIWGSIAERYDWHLFPIRRRLVVNSGQGAGNEHARTEPARTEPARTEPLAEQPR